jgi:hypothetical protein
MADLLAMLALGNLPQQARVHDRQWFYFSPADLSVAGR